ncbi:hypothetical protein LSAT2_024851, partial [Lamellibrachia satsuma]
DLDSDRPACLEDVFVDRYLQKHTTESFPETFSYNDLKEMETRVQSSVAIPIANLFSNLDNDVLHKTKDPTKVLIQGKPGVGKSTLVKHIANGWAKGDIWPDIKYVFLVPVRELSPNEKWSVSNLLLDGLIPPDRHKACLDVITGSPDEILVILDGYDEGGWSDQQQEHGNTTLISRIITNDVLPGAKILVTSRPTTQLPIQDFNHTVQLSGFTSESISEYVHTIARSAEQEEFILKCLRANPNMAGLCTVPLLCALLCACLTDIHNSAKSAEVPTMNTTTDVYVQATLRSVSKCHPRLKYNKENTCLEKLFPDIKEPLSKHADLARHSMMSSPPQFIFQKDDLDKFGFDADDINCGFLVVSQTRDPRFKGTTKPCWIFRHATMHAFFCAIGLARLGASKWERLEEGTLVDHLKTVMMFLAGLLGDNSHRWFMEQLVSEDGQQSLANLRGRMLNKITDLSRKLNDDTMVIATVFETQDPAMVHVVPTEIQSTSMSVIDMRAFVWVLENENYHIQSLSLCDINLSTYVTGSALSSTLGSLPALKTLFLHRCDIQADEMTHVARRLLNCQKVEALGLSGNDLSDKGAGGDLCKAIAKMTSLRCLG